MRLFVIRLLSYWYVFLPLCWIYLEKILGILCINACVWVFCEIPLNLDSFASKHVLTSTPQSVHMLPSSPVTLHVSENLLYLLWTASSVLSQLCLCVTAAVIVFIETSAPHGREEEGGRMSVCMLLWSGRMTAESSSTDYMLGLVINSRSRERERQTGLRR